MSTEWNLRARWAESAWLRRLLGLTPLPAPPHVFSMSPRGLRYARLEGGGDRPELLETHAVELPGGSVRPGVLGGPLADAAQFGEVVDALLARLASVPERASLVLSDVWMRLAFIEVEDLPRDRREQEEVFRWKLKRIVPYRIEDLRLDADEVPPLPRPSTPASGASESEGGERRREDVSAASGAPPRRFVVLFALEALLEDIERTFRARGVRLGRVVSESVATHMALAEPLSSRSLGGVVFVGDAGYSVLVCRGGEPVLYRFKSGVQAPPEPALSEDAPRNGTIERDLRLTRGFLRHHFPGVPLDDVWLLSSPDIQTTWSERIRRSLDVVPRPVGGSDVGPATVGLDSSGMWPTTLTPILGVASQEIT